MKRLWLMPLLVLVLTGSTCYTDAEIEAGALGSAETTLGSAPTPTTKATITATTSVSATTSTAAPEERSSSNTSNNVDAAGQPGTVTIHSGDCFDDDGPTPCVDAIDIIGFAGEPVAGSLNLFQLTITFAGPVEGSGDVLINVGFRASGSDGLGTNFVIEDGEPSSSFPGSDGPLPGESVSVDDQGRLVIVRDLSGLTGEIRVTIRTRTLTEPQIGDAVQISNVTTRDSDSY